MHALHATYHTAQNIALWKEGIRALAAAGPHVSIKLSMFWYLDRNWDQPGNAAAAFIKEAIEVFGAARCVHGVYHTTSHLIAPHCRCMLGSNYPVEKFEKVSPAQLFSGIASLVAHLSDDDKAHLYHKTAARVYKIST